MLDALSPAVDLLIQLLDTGVAPWDAFKAAAALAENRADQTKDLRTRAGRYFI